MGAGLLLSLSSQFCLKFDEYQGKLLDLSVTVRILLDGYLEYRKQPKVYL